MGIEKIPVTIEFFDDLWASAQAAKRTRAADMPTEQRAIHGLWNGWQRLKELGWREACYAPKETMLQIIEVGSTGIHKGKRDQEGAWWLYDDDARDVYPSNPVLYKDLECT